MSNGDCFPVAFKLILHSEDETYRLCHGKVERHTDGLHHDHAWVEYTEGVDWPLLEGRTVPLVIAIDKSNGNDVALPAAFYRKVGQAYDVSEYTKDEAMKLAVRHKHYGPWT